MKKRKLSILICVCFAALVMTSCGGGVYEDGSEQSGESTATITETSSTTTQTSSQNTEDATTVLLNMPDMIIVEGSYDGSIISIKTNNGRTILFVPSDGEVRSVELSETQIIELNTLYEQVTDFSADETWGSSSTVYIKHDGKTDSFGYGCAKQEELNQYLEMVMAL